MIIIIHFQAASTQCGCGHLTCAKPNHLTPRLTPSPSSPDCAAAGGRRASLPMRQGWSGTTLISGVAFAFDADAGWARLITRWVRLGAPAGAQPLPSNEAVMRC